MKRKHIITTILVVLTPILFFWLRDIGVFDLDETKRKKRCEHQKDAMKESLHGKIINKYEDEKNHNIRTIVINDTTGKVIISTILAVEGSGLYERLKIGDKVIKKPGQLVMIVESASHTDSVMLDYDCYPVTKESRPD
jgi:hypothetical protein